MKSKILILAFSLVFLLPSAQADFSDIGDIAAKKAIEYLNTEGIVGGYEDNTFRPERDISRAEFLKIILESLEEYSTPEDCDLSFPDISADDWFYPYVCYAVQNEIVAGYPDGTFRPKDTINFVESSKIIANSFDLEADDAEEGENWYSGFVKALNMERVVPNSIASHYQNLSRGEMAEMVWGIQTGNEVASDDLGDLPYISSCAELSTQINKYQKRQGYGSYGRSLMKDMFLGDDMFLEVEVMDEAMDIDMDTAESETTTTDGSASEFSTTNIQEFGVDEADIIKNDGSHIFMIKGNTVRILEAYPPEDMRQAAIISLDEGTFRPEEMYLDNDRLTIIGAGGGFAKCEPGTFCHPYSSDLKVFVFNVSDRNAPEQLRSVSFEADYISSRKIDDVVYLVANKSNYYYEPIILEDIELPQFRDTAFKEETQITECAQIRYFPNFQNPNYLIVASVDTRDLSKKVERETFLGYSNEIYASQNNLYVTRSAYDEVYYEDEDDSGWRDAEITEVFKFALDDGDIDFVAKNRAEGRVINQFAMSEYDNHFRIATQKGHAWGNELSSSGITIFDENMEETGRIEDIAPGENMKSARFMGNKAYLVTFKTVDPLFVIDLDPQNPQILGKLKIPGWSDYLHPYDENHLIGFGKEVDESIDADKIHSDNAIYYTAVLGMKLAIFDVSDLANPVETHKEVIGYRGTTSELLQNHKALLFDKTKGILAFPVTVTENMSSTSLNCSSYSASDCPSTCEISRECAEDDECTNICVGDSSRDNIQTVFAGAYVYDIDLENGFTLKGKVTHYEDDEYFKKSGEYFYGHNDFNIKRIIYIGDYFYSISDKIVKALNWSDISEKNSLTVQ